MALSPQVSTKINAERLVVRPRHPSLRGGCQLPKQGGSGHPPHHTAALLPLRTANESWGIWGRGTAMSRVAG